ncbi:hypothetical protein MAR_001283 [Mya arenaria]|uniref:Uncharacterized protein n=1 Tax=Mya arenaria TaxID=6604 RepID=A0ABY7FB90_MYAAR|nr:hypothetical protein MAR_001283 [Mya arenaria]
MCFLVTFIVYFVWTITSNLGKEYSGAPSLNQTTISNSTTQIEEYSNFSKSGTAYIPNLSASDEHQTDPPYLTRVVVPTHRKQAKRRRKKDRNRRRRLRQRNKKLALNSFDDFLNDTSESKRNRKTKSACSDCKIRKRKGRKHLESGRLSPTILRKVLEKVADDTLSGARAGDGSISSILKGAQNHSRWWLRDGVRDTLVALESMQHHVRGRAARANAQLWGRLHRSRVHGVRLADM